jgi:hypothetical protein
VSPQNVGLPAGFLLVSRTELSHRGQFLVERQIAAENIEPAVEIFHANGIIADGKAQ